MGDVRGANSLSQAPAWLWAPSTSDPSGTGGASGPAGAAPAPATLGAAAMGSQTNKGSPKVGKAMTAVPDLREQDVRVSPPSSRGLSPPSAESKMQDGVSTKFDFAEIAREERLDNLAQIAAFEGDPSFAGLSGVQNVRPPSDLDLAGIRVATEIRTRALAQISDTRESIQILRQNQSALHVHLGRIAQSSVSTQELARSLEGLGVSEGVRMDTAISLQALHLDTLRLSVFTSGKEAGLGTVVRQLQAGLPKSIKALDRMEADLNRPSFALEELLRRPEFAVTREDVIRALVPAEDRPPLRAHFRRLQATSRRNELLGGVAEGHHAGSMEGSKLAKDSWTIGSIAISTFNDLNRVRYASDYVNHGFAERNLEDRAAATFVLNRVNEAAGLLHPAAGAAVDALRVAETFAH